MWETQGIHKRVVSETLFMTGNAEKQHKGPSIKDWWKKLWCIHTMECSSVIKRNDIYRNSLAWKEHTIYCQVKEAMKQHISFNPTYQNAIFKIWFVYIRLGRPLKFCSSKCQGWFSLDDRMAGVLFVYLFGGRQFFFLSFWMTWIFCHKLVTVWTKHNTDFLKEARQGQVNMAPGPQCEQVLKWVSRPLPSISRGSLRDLQAEAWGRGI